MVKVRGKSVVRINKDLPNNLILSSLLFTSLLLHCNRRISQLMKIVLSSFNKSSFPMRHLSKEQPVIYINFTPIYLVHTGKLKKKTQPLAN